MRRKMKKENKNATMIAIITGGLVGGIYGISPWLLLGKNAGVDDLLYSWLIFPFGTAVLIEEGLVRNHFTLASIISMMLWVCFGALMGFIINKVILKIR
jgi:hypothetical protein